MADRNNVVCGTQSTPLLFALLVVNENRCSTPRSGDGGALFRQLSALDLEVCLK